MMSYKIKEDVAKLMTFFFSAALFEFIMVGSIYFQYQLHVSFLGSNIQIHIPIHSLLLLSCSNSKYYFEMHY